MPVRSKISCLEDLGEEAVDHALGAAVSIMDRVAEQATGGVEQPIVDAPGVDADAGQRGAVAGGIAGHPIFDFTPQGKDIPVKSAQHVGGSVLETMQHLDSEALAVPAPQQDAAVGGTQVCGKEIGGFTHDFCSV
jgi:hypothetical protein